MKLLLTQAQTQVCLNRHGDAPPVYFALPLCSVTKQTTLIGLHFKYRQVWSSVTQYDPLTCSSTSVMALQCSSRDTIEGIFRSFELSIVETGNLLLQCWLSRYKKFFVLNGMNLPLLGFTNLTMSSFATTSPTGLIAARPLISQRQWKASSDWKNIPLTHKTILWINLHQINLNSSAIRFARHGKRGDLCSKTAGAVTEGGAVTVARS